MINKLYDVGPEGFTNGISTEKYVNLCRVSRATAYRELTALCARWGVGADGDGAGGCFTGITHKNGHKGVDFGGPIGCDAFCYC